MLHRHRAAQRHSWQAGIAPAPGANYINCLHPGVSAQVPLPDAAQRRDVLRVTLEKYRLECGHEAPLSEELLTSVSVAPAAVSAAEAGNGGEDPLRRVAGRTQGFTGSDLVQLCSEAVRQPMREAMDAADGAASFSGQTSVRPLELR